MEWPTHLTVGYRQAKVLRAAMIAEIAEIIERSRLASLEIDRLSRLEAEEDMRELGRTIFQRTDRERVTALDGLYS